MEKITSIEGELDKLIIKFENEEKVNVKHYTEKFTKILYALGILTEGVWDKDKSAHSLDVAKEKVFKYLDILSEDKFDFETVSDEEFKNDDKNVDDSYDDDRIHRETKPLGNVAVLEKPKKKAKAKPKKKAKADTLIIPIPTMTTHKSTFEDLEYNKKQSTLQENIKKSNEEREILQNKLDKLNEPSKISKFFKSIFG